MTGSGLRRNVDEAVVAGFGDEWSRFDQSSMSEDETRRTFEEYFAIFPWKDLPPNATGFDFGSGSGRWARLVAPSVGRLHCIDASAAALVVARRTLQSLTNCEFHLATPDDIPLDDESADFGYSLGVLHHIPDTPQALRQCVRKLKPGAPFLVYLYYRFDNRPAWYGLMWRISEPIRFLVSRLPHPLRYWASQFLAATIYWPLARLARLAERLGLPVSSFPLNYYRDRSFYALCTDALDRFGTRLEQRFTRQEIDAMMREAGLENVVFSPNAPFWCAVGTRVRETSEPSQEGSVSSGRASGHEQGSVCAYSGFPARRGATFMPALRGPDRPIRVAALATYPVEAPSTRFRIAQLIPLLARKGIDVTLLPFLTSGDYRGLYDRKRVGRTALRLLIALLRRVLRLQKILTADVLFVQREAMLYGPPWVEWLAARVWRIPMVLDLDDPTWIPVISPVYGRLATRLKWVSKTDRLIQWAQAVLCGNETIAAHVRAIRKDAVVVPTVVDVNAFTPREIGEPRDVPILGWVGSHSTWHYVEPFLPVIEELARSVRFRFRVVGSGRDVIPLHGVDVEVLPWRLDREILDFQSLDVGIYPLSTDAWAAGKSGLKAVQYLACGVPWVGSAVGIVRDLGIPGVTHAHAATPDEWRSALERLLRDPEERRRMGAAGRQFAVEHFAIDEIADRIGGVIRNACGWRAEAIEHAEST